jgi:hypothetical protein
MEQLATYAGLLAAVDPRSADLAAFFEAMNILVFISSLTGDRAAASRYLARMLQAHADMGSGDLPALLSVKQAAFWHALYLEADPWNACTLARAALDAAQRIGNLRRVNTFQCQLAALELQLIASADAEARLRAGLKRLEQLQERVQVKAYTLSLILHLAEHAPDDSYPEVERLASKLIDESAANPWFAGIAQCALALVLAARRQWAASEERIACSIGLLAGFPTARTSALAALIRILLEQGRAREAAGAADQALQAIERDGGGGLAEVKLRVVSAEAMFEAGEVERARSELRASSRQIRACADRITDPGWRMRYLGEAPESARVRALSRAWIGEDLIVGP